MIDITIFPNCKKMAELQQKLLIESETEGRTLLRYFRADKGKSSGKLSIFLLPQAEEPLLKMGAIEAQLEEIEKDLEEFCTALGNYPNIRMLADSLRRERDKINRTARDARIFYERALKNHRELSSQQVQEIDSVREAKQKADLVAAECEPKVDDLSSRLAKAKLILEKYNNEDLLAVDKILEKE